MPVRGKHIFYAFILFLIAVFHFINNFIWLKTNVISYSGIDAFHHLAGRNIFYYNLLDIFNDKSCTLKGILVSLLKMFNTNDNWPRLVYFVSSSISLFLGNTLFIIFISTTLYLFILIISVYYIGRECAGKASGILAGFLISFYPAVFGLSRSFGLDLPLTAITALSVLMLIKANNFKSLKYSIFFGIVLGLGIITKGQIIFFLFAPLCYVLFKSFTGKINLCRSLLNIVIAFIIAAIISSVWWWGNIKDIFISGFLPRLIPFTDGNTALKEIFTFRWLFFYFFGTLVNVSPLFFIFFVIMFYSFLKSKIKYKALIMLWIIIPYIIFTIIYVKQFRFYLPAFPAFALVSAFGAMSLPCSKRKLASFFMVTWGLWQFFILSYISDGFLQRLIQERKIANFYNDRDKLYYQIQHSDKLMNIVNSFEAKIREGVSSTGKKNIRIGGFRFGRDAKPRYMKVIMGILGIQNRFCILEWPKDYTQAFDFLIIGSKDKIIDSIIFDLQRHHPDTVYRLIDGPYFFNPGKQVADFIFLLKSEKRNLVNNDD